MSYLEEMRRSELPDEVFGIPQERKYPMPDKKHVISAIKLFNHVEPKYEKQLAKKIINKMDEYEIDPNMVGEKNRLKKYLSESYYESSVIDENDSPAMGAPKGFLNRRSKPAKNQKQHKRYLKRKMVNKTNNATAQPALPIFNQIGEAVKSNDIYPIFIVTSYTNTPFGKVISTYTHNRYSHAAISFDSSLDKLYSFNADPNVSTNGLKGGISRESLTGYINQYNDAQIQVNCIFLKKPDFAIVKKSLDDMFKHESETRYGYNNIINILFNRAKDMGENSITMVCSQFVSYILHKADIKIVDKSDNLVTPKDLSTIVNPRVYKIYEGYARDYDKKKIDRMFRKLKTKALLIKESLIELCV